ncbi:hypothetical protein DFJ77DRAFT_479514 [Powellomyces hirtus]|nr:hypothetical protein DFJ77DRAFT_479514 [Powellomyces hirtus]
MLHLWAAPAYAHFTFPSTNRICYQTRDPTASSTYPTIQPRTSSRPSTTKPTTSTSAPTTTNPSAPISWASRTHSLTDLLITACANNDLPTVHLLLSRYNAPLITPAHYHSTITPVTPLTAACANNHLPIVRHLIDTWNATITPATLLAALTNHNPDPQLVSYLLDRGAQVTAQTLTLACTQNTHNTNDDDDLIFATLLTHTTLTTQTATAVAACEAGNARALRMLLTHHRKPQTTSIIHTDNPTPPLLSLPTAQTAVLTAATRNQWAVVRVLLDYVLDPVAPLQPQCSHPQTQHTPHLDANVNADASDAPDTVPPTLPPLHCTHPSHHHHQQPLLSPKARTGCTTGMSTPGVELSWEDVMLEFDKE